MIAAAVVFAHLSLAQALANAVAKSPEVAAARARVQEHAALLAAARDSAAPQAVANYAQAPQGGNDGQTIAQRLFTVGGQLLSSDYSTRRAQVSVATANSAGAQLDEVSAERSERIKTIGLYFNALAAEDMARVRSDALDQALSDARAAALRYRNGDVPRLDVVRSGVAVEQARADVARAQAERENALEALAVETDVAPSTLTGVVNADEPPYSTNVRMSGIATRSDLRSAQAAVAAQRALEAVATRLGLPAFAVTAGYTAGMDSGVRVSGPSATVAVSLPISRAARDRFEAERARTAQAQARYDALLRQVQTDVAASARSYLAARRAADAARRAVSAAQSEVRATQIGYRSGATSSLDVADARRALTQARLSLASAQYDELKATATLQQELGP